ncbi:hypothetical protein HK100_011881 [Physocladia obscura]|uniref:L domain-like protein n=1 Tax=Physocladia obscura TaxID=109957 RepID=A0AAD5T9D5_9FUNG|nr:hypothetical protein HK100_011881 [Physocladia obscura]
MQSGFWRFPRQKPRNIGETEAGLVKNLAAVSPKEFAKSPPPANNNQPAPNPQSKKSNQFLQNDAPTEIIEEIFTWIRPIRVGQLKRTCRRFNECLRGPAFVDLNIQRTLGPRFTAAIARLGALKTLGRFPNDWDWDALYLLPPSFWPLYAAKAFASLENATFYASKFLYTQVAEAVFHAPALVTVFAVNLDSRFLNILAKSCVQLSNLTFRNFDRFEIALTGFTNLVKLDFSKCSQSFGVLSAQDIAEMSRLRDLSLSGCSNVSFESLDSLLQLEQLEHLQLDQIDMNHAQISHFWKLQKLKTLTLSDCGVNGSLTDNLLQLTALETLILKNNSITGPIPAGLRVLKCLKTLNLSNNKLSGQLPADIKYLAHLGNLDVSYNQLDGPLPLPSPLFIAPAKWNLQDNKFEGIIPFMLFNDNLCTLDVSNNRLSGEIPKSISNAKYLQHLNLSGNRFSGTIPSDFANLKSLNTLLLDRNNFSGSVPVDLIRMPSLVKLDLSENQLSDEFDWKKYWVLNEGGN